MLHIWYFGMPLDTTDLHPLPPFQGRGVYRLKDNDCRVFVVCIWKKNDINGQVRGASFKIISFAVILFLRVGHTVSCLSRGADPQHGTYNFLEIQQKNPFREMWMEVRGKKTRSDPIIP